MKAPLHAMLAIGLTAAVMPAALARAQVAGPPLPGGMDEVRINAGTLDASGWTDATSNVGGFAVRLPCRFGEYGAKSNAQSKADRGFMLGCKQSDGTLFAALSVDVDDPIMAQRSYDELVRLTVGTMGAGKPGVAGGLKTVDFAQDRDGRCTRGRFIRTARGMISMSVESWSRDDCALVESDARIFFDSIRIISR